MGNRKKIFCNFLLHCVNKRRQSATMKAVTIRLDDEQAERLGRLSEQLHNSESGVVRFALDLLHKTISEKQAVPVESGQEAGAVG